MSDPGRSQAPRPKLDISSTPVSPLNLGGSDGTSGGMEARLAKVEAALEHIGREATDIKLDVRTLREHAPADFRILFGAVIAVALGLAALMAKGFHWI
ncbi:MAG: hypothetical protein ABWY18_12795 [Tardiphaga sp.]